MYPINDSTYQTVKYSFSDITENTLLWQDFYSRDDGTTWTSNWMMEFTRVAAYPKALISQEAHTWLDGSRCSADQYTTIKNHADVKSFEWKGESYISTTYKILDGCATLIFGSTTSYPIKEKLLLITYNTPEGSYEVIELNNDSKPLGWYRGIIDKTSFKLTEDGGDRSLDFKFNQPYTSFTVK